MASAMVTLEAWGPGSYIDHEAMRVREASVSSTGHLNTGKDAAMEETDAEVQEAKRSTRAKRPNPKYIGNVWMN